MRKWRWGGLSGLAYLVLLGCAQDLGPLAKEQPAQLIAMLQTGRPLLTCRDACLDAWRAVQPQVAQFNASERWQELAVLVLRTGYQDDLTLYYLGRAAEGLGYPVAAASYYRQSAGFRAPPSPVRNRADSAAVCRCQARRRSDWQPSSAG